MIVLVDADSIAYKVSAVSEFEEDVAPHLDEKLMGMLQDYAPDEVYIFVKGYGNFRKLIAKTSEYKGNRKGREIPPYLGLAYNLLKKNWKAIECHGFEADDYIAMYSKYLRDNEIPFIIYSIDKDLQQIEGNHYNYDKDETTIVSKKEANEMLLQQLITGDNGDNIRFNHGYGVAKAKKILNEHETTFGKIKAIRELYIKNYKSKYKEKYRECRDLIKLVDDYNLVNIKLKFKQQYF